MKDHDSWVRLLLESDGVTIFHHPDFLSYHKNKFKEYHIGIFKGEELIGILPLAIIIENNKRILKSPYGASYGGFIFKKVINYISCKEIIELFIDFCKDNSFNEIIITPSLNIYYKNYNEIFLFTMLENGFKNFNSDVTNIIVLNNDNLKKFNSRAKRAFNKTIKLELNINYDTNIEDFWELMVKTFLKHGANPTHSLNELIYLKKIFSSEIKFPVVYLNEKPIAGICEFKINSTTIMSFYICQDDNYKDLNTQTYLIKHLLDNAYMQGYKYYDFGTSSVNMNVRKNIISFKEGLGAISQLKNIYKLIISKDKE